MAERDPARFHAAVVEAAVAWRARHGTMPNVAWIDGHNHMSAVGSLGVDEAALGVPLARFVERNTAPALRRSRAPGQGPSPRDRYAPRPARHAGPCPPASPSHPAVP